MRSASRSRLIGVTGVTTKPTAPRVIAEADAERGNLLAVQAGGCGHGVQLGGGDPALRGDPVDGHVQAIRRHRIVVRESERLLGPHGKVTDGRVISEGDVPVVGARPGGAGPMVPEQPNIPERSRSWMCHGAQGKRPGPAGGRRVPRMPAISRISVICGEFPCMATAARTNAATRCWTETTGRPAEAPPRRGAAGAGAAGRDADGVAGPVPGRGGGPGAGPRSRRPASGPQAAAAAAQRAPAPARPDLARRCGRSAIPTRVYEPGSGESHDLAPARRSRPPRPQPRPPALPLGLLPLAHDWR